MYTIYSIFQRNHFSDGSVWLPCNGRGRRTIEEMHSISGANRRERKREPFKRNTEKLLDAACGCCSKKYFLSFIPGIALFFYSIMKFIAFQFDSGFSKYNNLVRDAFHCYRLLSIEYWNNE